MAKMIPNFVDTEVTKSNAEKKIFDWMKEDEEFLSRATILHSLNLSEHIDHQVGEADFVLLIPRHGIVIIEVKGGRIFRDDNGQWHHIDRKNNESVDNKSPFVQAKDNYFSIIKYISEKLPTLSYELRRLPVCFGCAFPDDLDFHCHENIEWNDKQVFDKTDGRDIGKFIRSLCNYSKNKFIEERNGQQPYELTQEDIKQILGVLRPSFDKSLALPKYLDQAERERQDPTLKEEQYEIIDQYRENPRIVVKGPAGTGKTIIAIELLRRSIAEKNKTLFLCFNNNLADKIKDSCADIIVPENKSCEIETFSQFVLNNIKAAGLKSPGQNLYDDGITLTDETMSLFIESLDIHPIEYDFLIVDEAQDIINDVNLEVLDWVLKRGLEGGHYVMFGDFSNQNIYQNGNEQSQLDMLQKRGPFVRLSLSKNYRNTVKIANEVEICGDIKYSKYMSNLDAKDVYISEYNSKEEEASKLLKVLEKLKLEGVPEKKITIIGPYKKDNLDCCLNANEALNSSIKNYSLESQKRKTTYCTISSFKGLENDIIIVIDIDSFNSNSDFMANLPYIGFSRAKTMLYVFRSKRAGEEYNDLVFKKLKKERGI